MGDVLLVVCGGGAKSALENAEDLIEVPMVILTKEDATIALDDNEKLKKAMRNYRVVIPFCIMGGEIGTRYTRNVIDCAREVGCQVVSVLGIPMEMEQDRRKRGVDVLPEIVSQSDCSLVFDLQKIMDIFTEFYMDRKFDFFFKMADRMIVLSMNSIIHCLVGPFFSTFTEKLYAFASFSDILAMNAVRRAWGLMTYDNNTDKGSCVIMISSHLSSAEAEDIPNRFVMEYGIMPEIVRRPDTEDSKVIVFKALKSF